MNYKTLKEEYLADPEHFDEKMGESIEVFLTQVEEQDPVMSQRLRAFLWRLDKNLEKENFSNDPPTKWMVRHTLLQDRFRKLVNGLDRRPANISIAKTEDQP